MSTTTNSLNSGKRVKWRGTWWITAIFVGFGLFAVWALLNLIIGGECKEQCVVSTLASDFAHCHAHRSCRVLWRHV